MVKLKEIKTFFFFQEIFHLLVLLDEVGLFLMK